MPSSKVSWKYRDIYEKIVKSAWLLSQFKDKDFTLQTAENLFTQNIDPEKIGLGHIALIPEFAAQIAGYTQSPQRIEGLHMFLDVGAGTIDVSLFNSLFNNYQGSTGEEKIPIFSSEVRPLGTRFLLQHRISILDEREAWHDHHSSMTSHDFANHFGCDFQKIRVSDLQFIQEVKTVLRRNIHLTRKDRNPHSSAWEEGLRTFMSGGGSRCELYSSALHEAFDELKVKLLPMETPFLDRANELREGSHRLSVAYGLTFDSEVIGKIVTPDEIPDIRPTSKHSSIDISELYS